MLRCWYSCGIESASVVCVKWNNFITGHFVSSLQKRKFPQVKMCKLHAKLRHLKREKSKIKSNCSYCACVPVELLAKLSVAEQRNRSEVLVCSLCILQTKTRWAPSSLSWALPVSPSGKYQTWCSAPSRGLPTPGARSFPCVVSPWRSFSERRWFTPDCKWEQNWDIWHYIKRSIRSLNKTNRSFEVV